MIDLTLPIPPTINHYYGHRGHTKYINRSGKVYRHLVVTELNKQGLCGHFGADKVGLDITLHLPAGGDIDNRLKPLLDALEAARLFDNDRQVDEIRVRRGQRVKGGLCMVKVWRI